MHGKSNFGIKPFLMDTEGKQSLQINSFKGIPYTEIFTELSMKFGALRGSSTSAKCDADEYFNITINYTFKMQQTFPNKHNSCQV